MIASMQVLAILVLSIIYLPVQHARCEQAGLVLKAVSSSRPEVSWDKASLIEADINCDGQIDYALRGSDAKGIYVAVVYGPTVSQAGIGFLYFGIGTQAQDSLCGTPAKLEYENLDYDPTEAVGEVPGFVRSNTCGGLLFYDGQCDPFHIYWNHQPPPTRLVAAVNERSPNSRSSGPGGKRGDFTL
jgi:hypothetical protein